MFPIRLTLSKKNFDILFSVSEVYLRRGPIHRSWVVEELYGQGQGGHAPAVYPATGVLALPPPLVFLQLPLPEQLSLPAHQPGRLVQREQDVVAGVRVRQEGREVQLFSGNLEECWNGRRACRYKSCPTAHLEDEGHGVWQELCERKRELEGEQLATNSQERVLRVAGKMGLTIWIMKESGRTRKLGWIMRHHPRWSPLSSHHRLNPFYTSLTCWQCRSNYTRLPEPAAQTP